MFTNQTNLVNETALNFSVNQTTNRTKINEETNESKRIDVSNNVIEPNNETITKLKETGVMKCIEKMSLGDLREKVINNVKQSIPELREELERMRHREIAAREKKSRLEAKREREKKELNELKKLNKDFDKKINLIQEEIKLINEKIDPLHITASKEKYEYLIKRIAETEKEKIKLKKQYEQSIEKLKEAKEKMRISFQKLEEIKKSKTTNEKFIDLCRDIFSDEFINYKILHMEKDTILLSFFYDFIQLEIQATNIANDISIDHEHLFKDNKCLNYPILKLFLRSTIDSAKFTSSLSTPYYSTNEEKKSLKKKSKKNVPVFIQYCVDLVLKEIGEGDLLETNKKYKYIRDIPMLITQLGLACKCALNLAKDFEYFSQVSVDTQVKCDFDFKNHLVSVNLPSLEDACFYKLKLNILPGKYYQEAIPFSIESLDPNDIMQPNIEQISKVVEGQYFEDGSLSTYLKKLKLV